MQPTAVLQLVQQALPRLAENSDELAALDAAAGDGDLGVTIRRGADAVVEALRKAEAAGDPGAVLRVSGAAFARGNPSSFAALIGAGLIAAARTVNSEGGWDASTCRDALSAATRTVAERGRAHLGDRTVLDAMSPALEALDRGLSEGQAPRQLLDECVTAAEAAAKATAEMTARRGRATWVGERALGTPDAGAIAFVRFLQALQHEWP